MFFIALIFVIAEIFNELRKPEIPREYFRNMELYEEDIIKGVPIEKRMENLANGKYK